MARWWLGSMFLVMAVAMHTQAFAACAKTEPMLIGGLKCDDPKGNGYYQIEVFRRCAEFDGKNETVLELWERGPLLHEKVREIPEHTVKSFIQDRMLAGEMEPRLFVAKLRGGQTDDQALCGQSTRTTLASVTCPTADNKQSYTLELDGQCVLVFGMALPAVLVVDASKPKKKVKRTINANDAKLIAYEKKGQKYATLMSTKLGKNGAMEAIAYLRPNGTGFDYIKLRVAPPNSAECTKIVETKGFWEATWATSERRGFIEVTGVVSADASRINQVKILITPLEYPACNRAIDIANIWDMY